MKGTYLAPTKKHIFVVMGELPNGELIGITKALNKDDKGWEPCTWANDGEGLTADYDIKRLKKISDGYSCQTKIVVTPWTKREVLEGMYHNDYKIHYNGAVLNVDKVWSHSYKSKNEDPTKQGVTLVNGQQITLADFANDENYRLP